MTARHITVDGEAIGLYVEPDGDDPGFVVPPIVVRRNGRIAMGRDVLRAVAAAPSGQQGVPVPVITRATSSKAVVARERLSLACEVLGAQSDPSRVEDALRRGLFRDVANEPVAITSVPSASWPEVRCGRCGLGYDGGPDWNAVMTDGLAAGFLCPGCQTPEENAEAVVNEATTTYGRNEQGRVTGRPVTEAIAGR